MRKYYDDEKVCVTCEYCDWNQEKTWCNNKKGSHYGEKNYHIGDTGCSQWKPCEQYREEVLHEHEVKKPAYGNGYIDNPWNEWQKKAYKKGLFRDEQNEEVY